MQPRLFAAKNFCSSWERTIRSIDPEVSKTARQEEDLVPELVDILLQVTIIGVVAYIPRYADGNFLKGIGGVNPYIAILLSLVGTIVVLVFARERTRRSSSQVQSAHLYS